MAKYYQVSASRPWKFAIAVKPGPVSLEPVRGSGGQAIKRAVIYHRNRPGRP
jgi:hypothetical protein